MDIIMEEYELDEDVELDDAIEDELMK